MILALKQANQKYHRDFLNHKHTSWTTLCLCGHYFKNIIGLRKENLNGPRITKERVNSLKFIPPKKKERESSRLGWQTMAQGANPPTAYFCIAQKLRLAFTFLNDWKKIKRRMLFCNIWNSNFSIHKFLHIIFTYWQWLLLCCNAKLSICNRPYGWQKLTRFTICPFTVKVLLTPRPNALRQGGKKKETVRTEKKGKNSHSWMM